MTPAQKRAAEIRAMRERKPVRLDGFEQKLQAKVPDGFVGRWVNDMPGRIEALQERGYTFAETAEAASDGVGTRIKQRVGVNEDGSVLNAYLMVNPKEIYDEDQAVKQRAADKIDEAIRRGATTGEPGQAGLYVPREGIKYERG